MILLLSSIFWISSFLIDLPKCFLILFRIFLFYNQIYIVLINLKFSIINGIKKPTIKLKNMMLIKIHPYLNLVISSVTKSVNNIMKMVLIEIHYWLNLSNFASNLSIIVLISAKIVNIKFVKKR